MRIVTTIRRIVGGTVFEPGQECEVDDRVAAVEIQGGRAKAPEKPVPAATAAPARAATAAAPAPKTEAAQPKASTEVKPMTLAQGPNPPGEYGTRDLKAKE